MRESGRASGRFYFDHDQHHHDHDSADNDSASIGFGKHAIASTAGRSGNA
jgi:hypothetical protein